MVHLLHMICREGVHNTEQAGCAGAGTSAPSRSDARCLCTEFPLEETNYGVTEHTSQKIWLGKSEGEWKMFLVKERRNGQHRAEIYMRPDGLFEGRIYRQISETASESIRAKADFEICGVTETLPRVETLVDEELGL